MVSEREPEVDADGVFGRRRRGDKLDNRGLALVAAQIVQQMQQRVEIDIALGRGEAVAEIFTCDLSYDYVRINAEYTT